MEINNALVATSRYFIARAEIVGKQIKSIVVEYFTDMFSINTFAAYHMN